MLTIDACSFLGGAFIGSLIQGSISARWGRRVTTAIAACLCIISGAVMAGSPHIAVFITFRVISGLAAGILTTNCPVYLSEISPFHTRGLLTGVHGVSINVAYTMSSLIALGINFIDKPYQWRLQFIIFVFFSLLLLGSLLLIPESPRWLIVSICPLTRTPRFLSVTPSPLSDSLLLQFDVNSS